MLRAQGWREGQGLGPRRSGIVEPAGPGDRTLARGPARARQREGRLDALTSAYRRRKGDELRYRGRGRDM